MEKAPEQIIYWIRQYAPEGLPSGFLDNSGQINPNYLPSYVDDVVDITTTGLPMPGEFGKIYIDGNDNKSYRWGGVGVNYVLIGLGTAISYKGNAGLNPSTDFIGTTDNQDLVFKRENNEYFRLRKLSSFLEVFITNNKWITFGRADGYRNGMSGNDSGILDIRAVHNLTFDVHNGDIIFKRSSGAVETMRLKATGNVLINTTTDAGYKIDVNGTSIFRDVLTIQKAGNTIGILLQDGSNGNFYSPRLTFKGSVGGLYNIGLGYDTLVISAPTNKYIAFGSFGQAGEYAVKINPYPYGVNTAPNNYVQKITLTSNTAVGLVIKNTTEQSPSPTGSFLEFRNASDSILSCFKSNGNLLIGFTTDNGNKLQVNGNSYFKGIIQSDFTETLGVYVNNTVTPLNPGEKIITIEDGGVPVGIGFVDGCDGLELESLNPGNVEKTIYYVNNGNGLIINSIGFWWYDFSASLWTKL